MTITHLVIFIGTIIKHLVWIYDSFRDPQGRHYYCRVTDVETEVQRSTLHKVAPWVIRKREESRLNP